MPQTRTKPKVLGRVIGLVLMAAAVSSVFLVDWDTSVPEEPPLIRPLKTMVIQSPFTASGRKYPGKVRANREVDLAFQVSGPLIEFPILKGQEVEEGELIARIDPRDFEHALTAAEARFAEAKALYERMEKLYNEGNASKVEYEEDKKDFEVAQANAKQAAKDLDDTYLRAPFTGVIANTFVDNFENVRAKQSIVSLQDVSSVEIEVHVPEDRVALSFKERDSVRLVATFDYLPGREFAVTVKEFSTEADPATQTYAATAAMPAPDDVTILPGMTATITAFRQEPGDTAESGYAVPVDAVPIDGVGTYYVWLVRTSADGALTVHRRDVQVGEMIQDDILVTGGLTKGDRIATAGVHLLQEGQQVRLLEPEGGAGPK